MAGYQYLQLREGGGSGDKHSNGSALLQTAIMHQLIPVGAKRAGWGKASTLEPAGAGGGGHRGRKGVYKAGKKWRRWGI